MDRRGFTRMEMIVVLLIIVLLLVVTIPGYIGMQTRMEKAIDIANATSIASAVTLHNVLNPDHMILNLQDAKARLSTGEYQFWPDGLSPQEEERAKNYVVIDENGKVKVKRD